jgi:hypothetical protein
MPAPVSVDLRQRIMAAYEAKEGWERNKLWCSCHICSILLVQSLIIEKFTSGNSDFFVRYSQ